MPVVIGVVDGGVYDAPVTITWDVGRGELNGVSVESGVTISESGEYVLKVTNRDKVITVSFGVNAGPVAVLGDPDGDGEITVSDALAALRIAAKIKEETPYMIACCDIDKDGEVTVGDALYILRVAVGLTTLPR